MELASPSQTARNASLDSPPPQPPASKGGGFMPPPRPDGGLGDMVNNPQLMSMQGLALVKDGMQLIANGLPALAQILSNTIMDLEQLVTQASADALAGQGPQITAPPGVAPMTPPMPGGPTPGGPPPGMGPGPMPGM